MSMVKVIFPVSDFSYSYDFGMYEEITEEMIRESIQIAVQKLYDGNLRVFSGNKSKSCETVEKCDQYESEDKDGKFKCQVFDLTLKGNKLNYFFLRIYEDE